MKRQIYVKLLILGISLVTCTCLYGWANKSTHPALTEKSIADSVLENYLRTQLGIDEGINAEFQYNIEMYNEYIKRRMEKGEVDNPYNPSRTILKWIKSGSTIEDEDGSLLWSIRSRHHFHDPTCNFQDFNEPGRNAGLDNKTDHPNYGDLFAWATGIYTDEFDVTGQSALFWTTDGFAEQEPNANSQSWQNTKDHFYFALTKSAQTDREEYLAMTFLDLGCVLHMIEDMGVPAHTRNDFIFGHLQYEWPLNIGNPLEGWVEEQVEANAGQSPWSGTGPVVFDKLAKYFDADVYDSNYLGDGQWPPEDLWGLAECTNYQFLSLSTVFGCSGVKYQFPHPDREKAEPNLLEPAPGGEKVYFDGSNYCVTHLARDSYTRHVAVTFGYTSYPVIDSTITTDDDKVFEDYAAITIPRTIDYATGLTNYFFRGWLNVEPNWTDPNIVELIITNDSNNSGIGQTIKGGTFELYWDDVNDTRTQIDAAYITFTPEWTPASVLPNDGGLTELNAQFAPPAEKVKNYIVVYNGNISENPADPDPNDPNAIAAYILPCGYEIIAWGDPEIGDKYGQISDVPDGNNFTDIAAGKRHCLALRSGGSLVAWGYNNYGECNVPDGTDYTAIAAGTNHSIALKSDGSIVVWGRDNLWQITDKPSGNDFVAIAAGDYHSLALKSDGTIVGWGGWNDYGECDTPAPDAGTVFTAVAAGKYHSMALQSDGTVKAWGSNYQGQTRIYDGAADEVHIAIAACDYYSFLLRDDGVLISWGGGDWEVPNVIPNYHYRYYDGTDFTAIAAGWDHILALTSDGEILSWYWPNGDFDFDSFSRDVPDGIVFTDDIAAGYKFSLALKAP